MVTVPSDFIVVWRDDQQEGRCRWTLRGIRPDGSFYGQATFYDQKRHANLQGKLSDKDTIEFLRLATGIRNNALARFDSADSEYWDGLLAEGIYSAPKIIYRYRQTDEPCSPLAKDFNALTALLRSYTVAASGG